MEIESESIVREFWRLMESNDFQQTAQVLSNSFVLEWPQSNERICGPENFIRMNSEYPTNGKWEFEINRLMAQGDAVVTHVSITDGQQQTEAISFFTIRNSKIETLTEYWPEPYAAPDNRKHLVEPIE